MDSLAWQHQQTTTAACITYHRVALLSLGSAQNQSGCIHMSQVLVICSICGCSNKRTANNNNNDSNSNSNSKNSSGRGNKYNNNDVVGECNGIAGGMALTMATKMRIIYFQKLYTTAKGESFAFFSKKNTLPPPNAASEPLRAGAAKHKKQK
ncbi:unnamed protein product [Ceratitis capitata]|uniref:(Mediterranean fruit fly) hypothetical protein n=1 Tax=Ceratitis capitata TaxID=7213 RepID=A0A811VFQ8_CERCA|nr:unnamed protein product [Ceratitis capitata]